MTSTKQDLLSPITVAFQQGLGQKFRQESGTRIDLSTFDESELVKVTDEGVYPIVIKAEASPCVSEDGSTNGGAISTNSQITQAVFEKEKGEYQNLFLHGYGAIFNFLGILVTVIIKGLESFNDLEGHSRATLLLIVNNAAQGILSSFFFKHADTILKKYSSTVATIFTGFASAAFFGHTLTINFMLGISIVFISMHQFFSPLAKVKEEENGVLELEPVQSNHRLFMLWRHQEATENTQNQALIFLYFRPPLGN